MPRKVNVEELLKKLDIVESQVIFIVPEESSFVLIYLNKEQTILHKVTRIGNVATFQGATPQLNKIMMNVPRNISEMFVLPINEETNNIVLARKNVVMCVQMFPYDGEVSLDVFFGDEQEKKLYGITFHAYLSSLETLIQNGLLHADLKSGNVVVRFVDGGKDVRVKFIDLAKLYLDPEDRGKPGPGTVQRTPHRCDYHNLMLKRDMLQIFAMDLVKALASMRPELWEQYHRIITPPPKKASDHPKWREERMEDWKSLSEAVGVDFIGPLNYCFSGNIKNAVKALEKIIDTLF
jgi:hypothetical protein